jgi:hypothetical protein
MLVVPGHELLDAGVDGATLAFDFSCRRVMVADSGQRVGRPVVFCFRAAWCGLLARVGVGAGSTSGDEAVRRDRMSAGSPGGQAGAV